MLSNRKIDEERLMKTPHIWKAVDKYEEINDSIIVWEEVKILLNVIRREQLDKVQMHNKSLRAFKV